MIDVEKRCVARGRKKIILEGGGGVNIILGSNIHPCGRAWKNKTHLLNAERRDAEWPNVEWPNAERPNTEWPNTELDPTQNRDPTPNDWTPNDQTPKGTERRKTEHWIWTPKDWTPKNISYHLWRILKFSRHPPSWVVRPNLGDDDWF